MQPQRPAKKAKVAKCVRFSNSTNTKEFTRTLGDVLGTFTHAENPVQIKVYSASCENHNFDSYEYSNGILTSLTSKKFPEINLKTNITTKVRTLPNFENYKNFSEKLIELKMCMWDANSQTNSSQESQVATAESLYASAVDACTNIKKNFDLGCSHFIFISAPVAATQAIAIKDLLAKGYVLKKEGNGNVNANAIIGENLQLKYFEGVYCIV